MRSLLFVFVLLFAAPAAAGVIYVEDCVIKANDVTNEASFYVEFTGRPDLWEPNAFNAFTIDILDSGQRVSSDRLDVKTDLSSYDLRFSLPLSEINNDNTFTYLISSYNGGEIGNFMYGEAIPVPEPKLLGLAIGALLIFAAMMLYYKYQTWSKS
jgi:hypothetical protein